jgi:hypothetical protein
MAIAEWPGVSRFDVKVSNNWPFAIVETSCVTAVSDVLLAAATSHGTLWKFDVSS